MKTVLFLCTGNSCRSQMAEGWAKNLKADSIKAYSAGTKTHGLNPIAVEVMKEENVDISTHTSKTVDDLEIKKFDLVVTVCDSAKENCPYLPGSKLIHIGFEDPPALTKDMKDPEEIRQVYRRVRNEIKEMVQSIESHF